MIKKTGADLRNLKKQIGINMDGLLILKISHVKRKRCFLTQLANRSVPAFKTCIQIEHVTQINYRLPIKEILSADGNCHARKP